MGRVSKWHVCGRGKKALNNPCFQNLDRETQLGSNVIKMALK